MALALVTTTFAGVSFANPTTGTGPSNTMASMDYDELELIVDFDANGTDYTSLTSEIHVWDDDNFSAWFGPEDMMEESDNTSWNTHWADISLVLFFNGSAGVSPMADEGTWYYVDAYVNDSYGYTVGQAYTQICMDNGSVCEDDQNGPDIEDIFNQIDANQDGAITASEIIDFENMERESNNESNLTAEEEADIADDVAEFDTGYDDGMGNTEDANDSMLEINEFTEMFLERNTLITGADAYLEDGVVRIEIHDDLDEVDYVWILIHDGEGNELINETYAGDENGDFQDWTSPDCCNEDGMYYITLYFYDEDNMSIDSDSFTLGGYDNDQMMFDMFDTDMSGNVSIDEYLDAMDNASDINGEDPMDNATRTMISNMFMDEDTNEDGELDLDEFLSF
ncbi:MAG TPA: EF-hand domain-containing protein, partial [Candidatus Poseidoniaceae archaeon]|nr:EF-hand domain-containing protein [Candidatus Poseidoniaceae archaeon]